MEPLFVAPTSAANVAGLLARVRDIGLAAHIRAKDVGFSASYTLNISSETYLLNLLRALLSEHPDLFPGATRAATDHIIWETTQIGIQEEWHKKLFSDMHGSVFLEMGLIPSFP